MTTIDEQLEGVRRDVATLAKFTGTREELEHIVHALHSTLKGVTATLHDLKIEAEDEPEPDLSCSLLQKAVSLENTTKELQIKLRQSILMAKTNQERAALQERERLLEGGVRKRAKETKQATYEASAELTDSLRQAMQMMSTEIERSASATQTLGESTVVLDKTRSQYSTFQSVMKLSGGLLNQLHRQSIMDRLILYFGLFVFLSTVAYIFWKRMWIPRIDLIIMRALKFTQAGSTKTVNSILSSTTTTIATPTSLISATTPRYQHHRDEL